MALFRAEVKPISRGKGHNAVAAAAYRAGEKLTDTNTYNPDRATHDFSKKSDVLHKSIILPNELSEASFSIARQHLWSQVEAHEITKRDKKIKAGARVAREWLLALPHELSDSENIALAEAFATRMANDLGVIADCCIHDPTLKSHTSTPKPSANTADKERVNEDKRNIHAHIMFTTRKATLNADHELIFTDKADCELDGSARKKKGLVKEADYLKQVRLLWADMLNERLIAHEIAPVTAASYKDRHLDVLPKIHTGRDPLTDAKRITNDGITERNERVFRSRVDTLQRLTHQADGAADRAKQYLRSTDSAADWTAEQTEPIDNQLRVTEQRIELVEQRTFETEQTIERGEQAIIGRSLKTPRPSPYDRQRRASTDSRKRAIAKLAEQEILFDQISERANENIRDRKPNIDHITDAINNLTIETTRLFLFRKDEPTFSDRQKEILERWAIENDLITADFRKNMRLAKAFFENGDNVQTHKNIVRLIRDPLTEEVNHSETLKSASLSDLNSLTVNSTNNISKTSNTANETSNRKHRP